MKITLVTIIVIVLCSCSSEKNNLVIIFERGNNIKEGNPVILNDYTVGKVEKIGLSSRYEVCVTISLKDSLKLPIDTRFSLTNVSIFESAIRIEPGSSNHFHKKNDSIRGMVPNDIPLDSIITTVTNFIDNSKPVKNQDSIITEIHELKEEVKKLNEK